jgi:hypothetical protein
MRALMTFTLPASDGDFVLAAPLTPYARHTSYGFAFFHTVPRVPPADHPPRPPRLFPFSLRWVLAPALQPHWRSAGGH